MSEVTPDFVGPPPRTVRGLSWGALVLTLLWLIRNGFWFTALLYVLCSIFIWPVALVIPVVFFIWGNKWSWSKGQRWRSYREFRDSQFNSDFLALAILAALLLIASAELL